MSTPENKEVQEDKKEQSNQEQSQVNQTQQVQEAKPEWDAKASIIKLENRLDTLIKEIKASQSNTTTNKVSDDDDLIF